VREAVGDDVDVLLDIHGNLGATEAITYGRMLVIMEWFPYWADGRYDNVTEAYEQKARAGRLEAPTAPGLGIELNTGLSLPLRLCRGPRVGAPRLRRTGAFSSCAKSTPVIRQYSLRQARCDRARTDLFGPAAADRRRGPEWQLDTALHQMSRWTTCRPSDAGDGCRIADAPRAVHGNARSSASKPLGAGGLGHQPLGHAEQRRRCRPLAATGLLEEGPEAARPSNHRAAVG
jgi:hypothetical protein